jgi:cytochrome b pre-mRNA-processing protein 3
LNPLHSPKLWRRKAANAEKLYGAIVAQARLAKFYRDFAVPDTLEGRFLVLSLHLFAVLHRLKAEGVAASGLAQNLTSRFMQDMETVLRELGVSDLAIPKRIRGLAASSASLLQGYEEALAKSEPAVADAIAAAFSVKDPAVKAATGRLAHHLRQMTDTLAGQSLPSLADGQVTFAGNAPGDESGADLHENRG